MTTNQRTPRAGAHLRRRLALIALACGLTGGCVAFTPDKIHYVWDADDQATCEACGNDPAPEEFVGLAFSGGGSRAAVFAAAGVQALHDRGLMNGVTHISSVSGGSFAASYLAVRPLDACAAAADAAACEADYFNTFNAAMRTNVFRPMEARQVTNLNRFLSPTRRISSLQEVLNKSFLDDATFGDLRDSPALFINAASFDTGRRFVFSNHVIPETPDIDDPLSREELRAASFSRPGCPHATPDDVPVSLAVATSAGFPPALGPVAIKVEPACGVGTSQYWHLGDGGILENTGVESLTDAVLRLARAGTPPRRAVIYSFDAGMKTVPEESLQISDLRLWTSNPARVVDIVYERGQAYRDVIWKLQSAELGFDAEILTFRYTDAVLAEWPASCGAGVRKDNSPMQQLRTIKTALSITPCNADLMQAAAEAVVEAVLAERAAGAGG